MNEMQNQNIEVNSKRRSPAKAILFSILAPGLGQTYNNQLKKALVFLLSLCVLVIICFSIATNYWMAIISFLLLCILRIYFIIEAYKSAKNESIFIEDKQSKRRKYITYFSILILVIFILSMIKPFTRIQVFRIPTPGNAPTIVPDDYVIADNWYYYFNDIKYGDMITFETNYFKEFENQDATICTFRVIGLPGDSINIINNIPSINGVACQIINGEKNFEILPNKVKHLISFEGIAPDTNFFKPLNNLVVPENHYFVMGDNRNNAADSRYMGCIHKDNINGKLLFTYWGESKSRMNIDLSND